VRGHSKKEAEKPGNHYHLQHVQVLAHYIETAFSQMLRGLEWILDSANPGFLKQHHKHFYCCQG
jgi:hypothetical protein